MSLQQCLCHLRKQRPAAHDLLHCVIFIHKGGAAVTGVCPPRAGVLDLRAKVKVAETTPHSQPLREGSSFREPCITTSLKRRAAAELGLARNVRFFQLAAMFYEGILLHKSLVFTQWES